MVPKGSYELSQRTIDELPRVAVKPNAATVRIGPTIMRLRYSLTRRAQLRGRSTRQTKLRLSSTFWMVEITV